MQFCAYCNTSGATVDFYVKEPNGDYVKYLSEYKKIGSTSYYVAEYSFNIIGDYEIYFVATKDNYTVTSATKTLTVTKAIIPTNAITAPKAITGLTYNGTAQDLVTAGTTNDGAMKYRLGKNGEFTDAIPTATDAGKYTVYYMVAGDNNHKDTDDQSVEVTIAKAKLSGVSVKQEGTLIYNGKEQTAAVIKAATAYGENEVKFTFSAEENSTYGDLPAFTNAGSYTVYYKAEADNHETFIGSFTVTIEKAIVTVTALDKTAYVRRKAPDLSNPVKDKDYTVSDLFGDDQLTGTIKLAYVDEDGNEIAPNMSQPGKTIIRTSGLTAPNENYAVVFVDGTLTILPRSSSGGSSQGDYVIKVITGEGGSLSPSGDVGVRKGEDLTFTITPDAGYAVADVKIDGKSIGATRTKTSMRPTPSRSAS